MYVSQYFAGQLGLSKIGCRSWCSTIHVQHVKNVSKKYSWQISHWHRSSSIPCSPFLFLVACYATLHPAMSVRQLVGRSVGRSVPFFLFRRFWAFRAYSSCPDTLVTISSTAPAHLHGARVAVYPAFFSWYFTAPFTYVFLCVESLHLVQTMFTFLRKKTGFGSFLCFHWFYHTCAAREKRFKKRFMTNIDSKEYEWSSEKTLANPAPFSCDTSSHGFLNDNWF